ncbi:MAG: MATE family efflux transporter [Clostridia bacterium]|nr:MATE family efflux transporter [Clostridia bacterium]
MAGFSKKDEKFRAYALSASPLKVLLTVSVPLALYQALQQIFKVLDALMASHIGSDAVSAVACLSQITLMITALGSGLAVGGSIKISEAYGQGDDQLVRQRVATVYAMAVLVAGVIALTLIPFAEPFLRLLQTPENLIRTGAGYFRVEILSLVVGFFDTVYIAIERSRGHARKILILNLVVILVKLSLSALFVYVVKGGLILIAVATLVGQVLILLYALCTMPRDDGAFRFSFRNIRLKKQTVLPVVNLAYPVSAEKMLFAAGKVVVNAMSGVYGGLTVGALGISNNIGGLTTSWHIGFTDGTAPLISQNRGAGKYRRTLQFYFLLIGVNVLIGLMGVVLVSWGLPWLASIFAQSKENFDPAFQQMIVSIHRWEMLGYITLGVNSATVALLIGYGYTKLTMVLNVMRVFVYRVPVLWALQQFTTLGVEAVGITMMISNVLTGITAVLIALPVVRHIHLLARQAEAIEKQEGTHHA